MSSQYITEPPPTATVLVHTTAGPLTISIFAQQTPLAARNFLQSCLDGYYDGTIFHRVAPGFVIQTGDPTGTGEGGQSIYEDREFERYDKDWANLMKRDVEGDKIVFGDEVHTRLKFNRRGLVGMAKGTGQGGGYGSQFFITLGDCRAELDGKCTMFGRVEGDGIYNVVKIAEGECIEGTERPMYPEKILNIEVLEMPRGAAWEKMSKRTRVAARTVEEDKPKKKIAAKKKSGKALLSFGADEGEDEGVVVVRPKKAKFNTALIDADTKVDNQDARPAPGGLLSANKVPSPQRRSPSPQRPLKRKADASPHRCEPMAKRRTPSPVNTKRRKPSFHDSTTQLPLRDPEFPSRSPSPDTPPTTRSSQDHRHRRTSSTTKRPAPAALLEAEIAALKQSMRRDTGTNNEPKSKPKTALESLIPTTSTRGRKRPRPGDTIDKEDKTAMNMLAAFRARLEKADSAATKSKPSSSSKINGTSSPQPKSSVHNKSNHTSKSSNADASTDHNGTHSKVKVKVDDDSNNDEIEEEARLCDLHFISNCQSCFSLSDNDNDNDDDDDDDQNNPSSTSFSSHKKKTSNDDDDNDNPTSFLTHSLTFEKDRLGKDLTWKKKNEEELVVIDPREREKGLGVGVGGDGRKQGKGKGKGKDRIGGRERGREHERGSRREWDR